ncbi:ATP-binding protein [Hyphobacterium sp. WM6]|uniref:sensor histidine kinase n=1 Tax=Hyphobacterium sp. WM6 TaxID=3140243 RepID=UPI0031B6F4AB
MIGLRFLNTPGFRLGAILFTGLALGALVLASLLSRTPVNDSALPPLRSLWSLAVGLLAFTISGWVWALRPRDLASRIFLISGLSTLCFTYGAALYGGGAYFTPEWAMETAFYLNVGGATGFGIAMIVLFLVYPVRIPGWPWLAAATVAVFTGWTVLAVTRPNEGHPVTLVEMLCIIAMIAVQFVATRGDPKGRAILIWFGVSVVIGAGSFILLVALPNTFMKPSVILAEYAFAFFLIIYLGVAAGLRRYRLFELEEWSFRVLFYALGAVFLIALDAALIFLLSLGQATALGVSLLLVAFLYLPFRDVLFRALLRRRALTEQAMFQAVLGVAFDASETARSERWTGLWRTLFDPLEVSVIRPGPVAATIAEEGAELLIPASAQLPALRLRHPWQGRGLFAPRHQKLAEEVSGLMRHAEQGRRAYDRGVAEERVRIARDMHDNIGAQLLGALHSTEPERKNTMIRETLTDLREIINNAPRAAQDFDETLADLRAESAERLAAAEVRLSWTVEGEAPSLSANTSHALRSIVREAVSNVIKHAGAGMMDIRIAADDHSLGIVIRDDGRGFDAAQVSGGHGLVNLRARVEGLNGEIGITPSGPGTSIEVRLPLEEKRS